MKDYKKQKATRDAARKALGVNVKQFTKEKEVEYPIPDEIYNRLREVIMDYNGEVSLSEVLGVLRIIEYELISDD